MVRNKAKKLITVDSVAAAKSNGKVAYSVENWYLVHAARSGHFVVPGVGFAFALPPGGQRPQIAPGELVIVDVGVVGATSHSSPVPGYVIKYHEGDVKGTVEAGNSFRVVTGSATCN